MLHSGKVLLKYSKIKMST